jgi:hypothetical protein
LAINSPTSLCHAITDIQFKGEHRAHTIIATDTFVKMGSAWKQVASHGSEAK